MKLIPVMSHDNYYTYSQFYRPFCKVVKKLTPPTDHVIRLYSKQIS
jgi:hypothetical protein